MANEITVSVSLSFSKGGKSASFKKGGVQLDMTGTDYYHGTQRVGTTAEALNLGEVATPGMIAIINHDTTNFVEVRHGAVGDDVVKLRPGVPEVFDLASSTPYAIADTAECEVEYLLIEA